MSLGSHHKWRSGCYLHTMGRGSLSSRVTHIQPDCRMGLEYKPGHRLSQQLKRFLIWMAWRLRMQFSTPQEKRGLPATMPTDFV